jgi:hypothetical protein
VSSGNGFTLTLNTAKDGFCLVGTDTKATHDWVYVSSQGGLQPAATTACPSSF